MSDVKTVNHLTLTTGHLRVSPRAEVSDDVIARLRPLVAAQEGPVPGMPGWFLDFMLPLDEATRQRKDGAAFFQIAQATGMSNTPAIIAVAAWDAAMADTAWSMAEQGYLPLMAVTGGKPAPVQPELPWLAVWLTPFALEANPEDVAAFGDLERCVFWTLAETRGTV